MTPRNRTGKGGWRKGQSGNPRGRPPAGRALAERLRAAIDRNFDAILLHHMGLATGAAKNPTVEHAAIRTAYEGAGLIGRAQVSVEGSTEAAGRPMRLVIEL